VSQENTLSTPPIFAYTDWEKTWELSARTACLEPRFESRTSLMLLARKRSSLFVSDSFPWQPAMHYSLMGFKPSCFHTASWLIDSSLSRASNPTSRRNLHVPARGADNSFLYLIHPSLRLSNYASPPRLIFSVYLRVQFHLDGFKIRVE
jgi:hypothetical protein